MTNNKQRSFMELYKPIHNGLARFCEARCYGIIPPQDLLQETLLIAFDRFETIKEPVAFKSYLFTIARRLVKDKARKLKFKGELREPDRLGLKADCDPTLGHDISLLYRALDTLPDKQAEALTLFELSGFSLKEIQAIQGGSLSAVKLRLKRGRHKLRSMLTEVQEMQEPKHSFISILSS